MLLLMVVYCNLGDGYLNIIMGLGFLKKWVLNTIIWLFTLLIP